MITLQSIAGFEPQTRHPQRASLRTVKHQMQAFQGCGGDPYNRNIIGESCDEHEIRDCSHRIQGTLAFRDNTVLAELTLR